MSSIAVASVAGLVVAALATPAQAAPRSGSSSDATRPSGLWHSTTTTLAPTSQGHERRVDPSHFRAFTLDPSAMRGALAAAPALSRSAGTSAPGTEISIPAPDGTMVAFRVYEAPVMMAKLQARHPELQTYAGTAVSDPRVSVRMDVTPLGFHASVRSPGNGGSWYIDPAYQGRTDLYLSYLGTQVSAADRGLVEPDLGKAEEARLDTFAASGQASRNADEVVTKRTYRLALVSDSTYAAYFGSANVLAEKVTLMNRVNQIYNDDDAFNMVLVNQEDNLNFDTDAKQFDPNGPCGINACFLPSQITGGCVAGSQFTRLRYVLGKLVGSENYDIGHIMLGINGGGVAGLGVVGTSNKASGCTGLPQPQGDFMAIDYVAHEMGHEFGGNHTFNGNQYNCSSSNRNGRQGVEPGSGSSVMAYAGICLSDDLQPHTDPYFSQRSQTEFDANATAAKPALNEIQTVDLANFVQGDSFTLTATNPDQTTVTTAPLTRDVAALTTTSIRDALATALGAASTSLTVAAIPGGTTDNGFSVTFTGAYAGQAQPLLSVAVTSGDNTHVAQGAVSETIQGGPATNGGTTSTLGNHAPSVTAPEQKTIPVQTPFELTGSGSDSDGDGLLYLWEENDNGLSATSGGVGLTSNTKATGPLFRVFGTYADVTPAGTLQIDSPGQNHATGDASRTFPDMDQILNNQTNAATGSCPTPTAADYQNGSPTVTSGTTTYENRLANGPVLNCLSEFLPTAAYVGVPSYAASGSSPVTPANNEPSLNFRLTARDVNPTNGGYSFADTKLVLDSTAGPLLVTSQNGGIVTAGSTGTVTWAVNNTDKDTLAPNVKILLSTDGGHTWDTTLVDSTPNNGSAQVTWPNTASTDQARIRVQAVGNYFFDVDDADFTIASPLTVTGTNVDSTEVQYTDHLSDQLRFVGASKAPNAIVAADPQGLPNGLSLEEMPGSTNATVTWTVVGTADDAPGTYPVTVDISDGQGHSGTVSFTITVDPEDATAAATGPASVQADASTVEVPLAATVTDSAVGGGTDDTIGDISKATVTFVDSSDDTTLCEAPVVAGAEDGVGTASCSFTTAGGSDKTVDYRMVVGGHYTGEQTGSVDVVGTGAPQTTITSGPRNHSFWASDQATFGLSSSISGAEFTCQLDGQSTACDSQAELTGLKPGTHTFSVAASVPGGQADASPATRSFTVPRNAAAFRKSLGPWQLQGADNAYGGLSWTAKAKAASIKADISKATALALVVAKGPKLGGLRVSLNGTVLRTVSLRADHKVHGQVVVIARFDRARSGVLTVTTTSPKVVQVEGLGVQTS
jgi:hypothetical protein